MPIHLLSFLICLFLASVSPAQAPLEEGHVDSGGVKIHYMSAGKGPLVVLLHGFPDFWMTWRDQIPELAKRYRVVAIDLRGYNLSDQPKGVENYTLDKLIGDVEAVVKHFKEEKAIIVGHDWGGAIAWGFAMKNPKQTERLIVLNLPHPKGLMRQLKNDPEQQKASEYARQFQKPEMWKILSPDLLAAWVKEKEARQKYVEAFKRSSIEKMLHYYQANYPKEPYRDDVEYPKVKCPVLMIHGLDDPYLLPGALNDTWKWVEQEFTLVTIPKAGHFVHRDATGKVNRAMLNWLQEEPKK